MASLLTFDEVVKHNKNNDCWLIISGKVYDVSEFIVEHPGGIEVLIAATGKDATRDFEYVQHSNNAKKLMEKYCIGKIDLAGLPVKEPDYIIPNQVNFNENKGSGDLFFKIVKFLLLPIIILGLALVYQKSDHTK